MNALGVCLFSAAVVSLCPPVRAEDSESRFAKDYYHITEDYEARLEKATAPIEKKYLADLKSLLERAMGAADLDGALLIQKAIDELEKPRERSIDPAKVKTSRMLQRALIGTTWSMSARREEAETSTFPVRFISGTQATLGTDAPSPWEAIGRRKIKLADAILEFDEQLRKYECEKWYNDGSRYGVRR